MPRPSSLCKKTEPTPSTFGGGHLNIHVCICRGVRMPSNCFFVKMTSCWEETGGWLVLMLIRSHQQKTESKQAVQRIEGNFWKHYSEPRAVEPKPWGLKQVLHSFSKRLQKHTCIRSMGKLTFYWISCLKEARCPLFNRLQASDEAFVMYVRKLFHPSPQKQLQKHHSTSAHSTHPYTWEANSMDPL